MPEFAEGNSFRRSINLGLGRRVVVAGAVKATAG